MIAYAILWKHGSPKPLPDRVDIPVGVELEFNRQNRSYGIVSYWLETTYKWGVQSFVTGDETYY